MNGKNFKGVLTMDIVAYKIGKSKGGNSGTETVTIDIKDIEITVL